MGDSEIGWNGDYPTTWFPTRPVGPGFSGKRSCWPGGAGRDSDSTGSTPRVTAAATNLASSSRVSPAESNPQASLTALLALVRSSDAKDAPIGFWTPEPRKEFLGYFGKERKKLPPRRKSPAEGASRKTS